EVAASKHTADYEDNVGGSDLRIGQRRTEIAADTECQLIGLGESTLAASRGSDRRANPRRHLGELIIGLTDAYAIPGDDYRTFGCGDNARGLFDCSLVGAGCAGW